MLTLYKQVSFVTDICPNQMHIKLEQYNIDSLSLLVEA